MSASSNLQKLPIVETAWEEIDPLEKSFVPVKQQAFHRYLHPYFTKQAHNVVQNYIKYYSAPGEIVCDPFCGTGVVGVEALGLGRSAVCVDLSPLAEFMTRVLLEKNLDQNLFERETDRILKAISPLCKKIEEIGSNKPLLSDVHVPAWLKAEKISLVNLSTKLPRNADVQTVKELFDVRQHYVGSVIKNAIMTVKDSAVRDAMLLSLCGALARSNLTYLLSGSRGGSILHNGGPSIFGEYRYHVPGNMVFVPMFEMFVRRLKYLKQIKSATNAIYSLETNRGLVAKVIRGNALELTDVIRPNSIDYIYTDPPYGAHIAYLDLATMWSSWMDWKISDQDRKSEVIEGGDVGNSLDRYLALLNNSIEQSYKVLKPGRWLSIVFQHKDSAIWSALVNGFKDIGFQYRNTVVQRTFNTSIHKKKNPLNVLAEQLILNFTKSTKTVVAFRSVDIPVKDLVIESANKAIILYDGATLDDIYNTVTPALIEAGLLHESKNVLDNLETILQGHFALDKVSGKFKFKSTSYLKSNLGTSDRVVLYLRSVFNKSGNPSLDQIITSVLPNIAEDRSMKDSDLFDELHKIARTRDGRTFVLRDAFEETLSDPIAEDQIPTKLQRLGGRIGHNDFILSLAQLGLKLGYRIWIGKPEQAKSVRGVKLSSLSMEKIPIKMKASHRRLLNQIDCIWFHENVPVQAFEVEMSTDIEGAFKRFFTLLEVEPKMAGRLHVIANDSMKQKLQKVFTQSVYVGHPHLMQTKVNFCFAGSFVSHWNTLCSLTNQTEETFLQVFSPGRAAHDLVIHKVRGKPLNENAQMELTMSTKGNNTDEN